jgi:DNA-binding transcriptional LysR family regulator
MEAAVNAQGVALARMSLVSGWLESGALVRQFEIEARPQSTYYLCWKKEEPLEGARAPISDRQQSHSAQALRTPEPISAEERTILRARVVTSD